MNNLLLMKSNFRKSRGISVGITILILFASLLLSAALIILFDFVPNSDIQKEKLNAGDTTVLVTTNIAGIDDNFVSNTLSSEFKEYEYSTGVGIQYDVKYGSGSVTPFVFIS